MSTGAGQGDFGADHPGYSWESTVADWQEARMQEVSVAVRWEDSADKHQVLVNTLIIDPSTAAAASQPAAGGIGGTP